MGQRWTDATATVSEGRVVVTPVESDHLHCLDLVSGQVAWAPLERGDLLYTACAHDGRAIIVGGSPCGK